MHSASLLKAKVQLFTPTKGQKPKTLNFKIHPEREPLLTDTLMPSFSDLQMSEREKRGLTQQQREEICFYRLTSSKELSCYAKRLASEINKSKSKSLIIKAGDFGTFVCLAAIFSGEINSDKDVQFELSLAPIKLFPKDLVLNKNYLKKGHSVVFRPKANCWLKNFESLIWQQGVTDQFLLDESVQNSTDPLSDVA